MMKKSFGPPRSGGAWKKPSFGGAKQPWKKPFSDRGHGGGHGGYGQAGGFGKPLFPATCAECGTSCEVPFKPNGKKPVLCRNCFKKGDGEASFSPRPSGRPFGDKPSFSRPSGGDSGLSEQLRMINEKLDLIIEALED